MKNRILSLIIAVALFLPLFGGLFVTATGIITIAVENAEAVAGEVVDVRLLVSENPGIAGLKLDCSFPDGWLLLDIQQGNALQSLTLTEPGTLTTNPVSIVLDGLDADTSNGVFVTLTFKIPSGTTSGRYDIDLAYSAGDIYDDDLNDLQVMLVSGEVIVAASTQEPEQETENQLPDAKEDPVTPTDQIVFEDVSPNDWFWEAVSFVSRNGIMTGIAENKFAPHSTVSRAMMAQILYNLEGRPAVSGSNSFIDGNGKWYTPAATWAAQNGIVTGFADGSFGPDLAITREQIVVMLYRYAAFKGYDMTIRGNLTAFSDSNTIGSYAYAAMEWAVAEGLITGMDGGRIFPKGPALRCQIAAIMDRFLK